MAEKKEFDLIVNKQNKSWADQFITGSNIKTLAGSSSGWQLGVFGHVPISSQQMSQIRLTRVNCWMACYFGK